MHLPHTASRRNGAAQFPRLIVAHKSSDVPHATSKPANFRSVESRPLSHCLHPRCNLSPRQTKPLLIPITPLQLPRHTHAIAGLANPILLFALTIAPVGMPILKRRQILEELEGLTARLHLCVFARARGAFGHNLVVDHDGRDGGWETAGYDGWDFAGHDAVAGAAEGER